MGYLGFGNPKPKYFGWADRVAICMSLGQDTPQVSQCMDASLPRMLGLGGLATCCTTHALIGVDCARKRHAQPIPYSIATEKFAAKHSSTYPLSLMLVWSCVTCSCTALLYYHA